MGFFDLNIPYLESPPSDTATHKAKRLKIVIKAMELGYSGVAYNSTIRGVMSDRDRCSISRLTLFGLLKVAPSLSSSVYFHRDLLGVPRASPFRQYTRLTVCADTIAQCQVLNTGNPVLKSYDLVAVRPLNQSAFDHACEKAEVDIISIDFAEKLPFRLKRPMVKAAVERGIYFEVTYSDLILNVQLRRQMISNTKLMVDWTRGKNLILSSGASSVNEFRGPYDVANLLSLLGLSMERAKAAISKNCRTLISNALRKKHFHKETIRVEAMSSGEQFDSNEPWSGDWLKWDPISSGEGDLQLDDMAESFTASSKMSKVVKSIDFASVVGSTLSCGFQVKDLISGTQAVSQSQDSGKNILSAAETIKVSVATHTVPESLNRLDTLHEVDQTSLDNVPSNNKSSKISEPIKNIDFASVMDGAPLCGFEVKDLLSGTQAVLESQDSGENILSAAETIKVSVATDRVSENPSRLDILHETDQIPLDNTPSNAPSLFQKKHALSSGCKNDQELDLPSDRTETIINTDIGPHPTITEGELKNWDVADKLFTANETERDDRNSQNFFSSHEIDLVSSKEIVKCQALTRETELGATCNAGANLEGDTQSNAFGFPVCQNEESKSLKSSGTDLGAQDVAMVEVGMEIDIKDQEQTSVALDGASLQGSVTEGEHVRELVEVVSDQNPLQGSYNEMDNKDDSSVANQDTEVTIEEQRDGDRLNEPGHGKLLTDKISIQESCIEIIDKDDSSVTNHGIPEEVTMEEQRHGEQLGELRERIIVDHILFPDSSNKFRLKDDSSDANQEGLQDVIMEEQIHGATDGEINHPVLVQCVSATRKVRAKPRIPRRALLFPLKRLLNPLSFKKKSSRFKHEIKNM